MTHKFVKGANLILKKLIMLVIIFVLFAWLVDLVCYAKKSATNSVVKNNASTQPAYLTTYSSLADDFKKEACPNTNPALAVGACNFWQTGLAAQTMAETIMLKGEQTSTFDPGAFSPSGISKIAYTQFHKTFISLGFWYDDYGWWGNTALTIQSIQGLSAADKAQWLSIAKQNWEAMKNGAMVWERYLVLSFHPNMAYKPKYVGGIWNNDISVSGGCSPGAGNGLCGIQNTATNGLFNLLSKGLASIEPCVNVSSIFQPSKYLAASYDEDNFLENWFYYAHDPLLYKFQLNTKTAVTLIHERVPATFDPFYKPHLIWTGDQGLIMVGLVENLNKYRSGSIQYKHLLKLIESIIDSVAETLVVQPTNTTYQLLPWKQDITSTSSTPGDAPGTDGPDYNIGVAAFLTNLITAYESNADLQNYINNSQWPAIIKGFATYLAQGNSTCYFSGWTTNSGQNCSDVTELTNKLAVYNADIAINGTP